ncbi:MAG: arginine--tRNA ligase [Desulfohalobiaceae bacterium]|nr:arginine--tRNA ligase [Desulfohalobiaceae bacterium]
MRAKQYLYARLRSLVQDRGLDWPEKASLESPKKNAFGDLASNLALVLSKEAGIKPRDLAAELRTSLLESTPELQEIEIAGPGFMNFFFSPDFWRQTVPEVLEAGDGYGSLDFGQGHKVLVEFVSANPTGPLHVGHGRGAAVGDSLCRILRFAGYLVDAEYYLNDAGRQMDILARSLWIRYQQVCGSRVELPGDSYQGEYITDLAEEFYREHGRGLLDLDEPKALELCLDKGKSRILAGIKQDLQDFRVEFDRWFSEKELIESRAVDKTLENMLAGGLAYEQDGALWFKSTDFGDDKDRVLRKSDGELTYFASDIAYHAEKFSRGYETLIDVWGADHHGYVPRMKSAVVAQGRAAADFEVVLIQLVNLLRKGEQIAMSTRAGKFVTLAEVIAEVGVDASRFTFLSRKSDSRLEFDLDLLKQKSMENPVFYVQYAHARICSVLRKAGESGQKAEPDPDTLKLLNTDEDLELIQTLERFPDCIQGAARLYSPHLVSYYLRDLAGMLHRYYNRHQIVNAGDERLTGARLLLVKSVLQVLKNGLNLLGVQPMERM